MFDADIVLYQQNHYKPLIDQAIRLTEKYVSENKLILTGGMAIDLALRAKGKSIYDDDALPDYDIISDKNIMHANALAEIFCKEGLPDVNVINAVHMTTVRVRVKNIVFLDSTYIPPDVYKHIPYIDTGHLRVVHPHYQFIDQRTSMGQLLNDTGLSLNIFNRLLKDTKRNLLLREEYPIPTSNPKIETHKVNIPLELVTLDNNHLNKYDKDCFIYTGPVCISGYLGYLLLMIEAKKIKNEITITDKYIQVQMPKDVPVSLLTCTIDSIKPFLVNPITHRPLVNLKPISLRDGDFEFIDTYGTRNGCFVMELDKNIKICVASTDFILMELLRDRIYIRDEPYSFWYTQLVAVVDAQRKCADSIDLWWPSLNVYGEDNLPEYRMFMLEKLMNPEGTAHLKPKNSYPKKPKCATKSGFVEEDSHYFRIDGAADTSIKHTNYKFIKNEFNRFVTKKRIEQASQLS